MLLVCWIMTWPGVPVDTGSVLTQAVPDLSYLMHFNILSCPCFCNTSLGEEKQDWAQPSVYCCSQVMEAAVTITVSRPGGHMMEDVLPCPPFNTDPTHSCQASLCRSLPYIKELHKICSVLTAECWQCPLDLLHIQCLLTETSGDQVNIWAVCHTPVQPLKNPKGELLYNLMDHLLLCYKVIPMILHNSVKTLTALFPFPVRGEQPLFWTA